jgi:hypothetical protein
MQLASRLATHHLERSSILHDADALLDRRVDLMLAQHGDDAVELTRPDVTLGTTSLATGTT